MIRERPYATARSSREALAELRRGSGTQFDPDVVEAFAGILGEVARNGGNGAGPEERSREVVRLL
jgi:HD-GYP domain-containing protein (c-di-GMP phosphodiesterase class II)